MTQPSLCYKITAATLHIHCISPSYNVS
uniref:Uncharacterized protein n=1 Tax=Anguilla anguilla TaxID=7936 RepID=A0A0E9PY37_ANGAN